MAWIDGYEPIADPGESPHGAPGTEVTNEARETPGPGWAKQGTTSAAPKAPGD